MIAYVYKDNKVIAIVENVIDANDTDIIGIDSSVKGNSADVILLDESLSLSVGDEIATDGLNNKLDSFKALKELEQLDLIVPRILEDIVSQGNFNIHQSKLDVIARKQVLRGVI
jgi:hypothetical protein